MIKNRYAVTLGLSLIALTLVPGCGDSGNQVKEEVRANTTDKPILLKDLTTGILYDTKKFPKPNFKFEEDRHFKYQYFGEPRDVEIKVTSKNVIYDIKMSLDIYAEEVLVELEKKLTLDNGKPVRFDCAVSSVSLEPLGIKNSKLESKECKIKGKSQELVVKLQKPTGTAAITRLDLIGGEIRLKDTTIEAGLLAEKNKREAKESLEAEKKRKSDI